MAGEGRVGRGVAGRRAEPGKSRRPPLPLLGSFSLEVARGVRASRERGAAQSRALPPRPRLRRGGRARAGDGTGGRSLPSRAPAPLCPGVRAGGTRGRGQWIAAGGHLTGGLFKGTEWHPGAPAGKGRFGEARLWAAAAAP